MISLLLIKFTRLPASKKKRFVTDRPEQPLTDPRSYFYAQNIGPLDERSSYRKPIPIQNKIQIKSLFQSQKMKNYTEVECSVCEVAGSTPKLLDIDASSILNLDICNCNFFIPS